MVLNSAAPTGTTNSGIWMSGKLKAAILLVALAPDVASAVFRHLTDPEVEALTQTISSMPHVTQDTREAVMQEFHAMAHSDNKKQYVGPSYARELLEKSLGRDKAEVIMSKLDAKGKERPFNFARHVEPAQLAEFIRNEHPQTIALILAHLPANNASVVMSALPAERQVDVARRLATMDRADPELLREVDNVLRRRLLLLGTAETQAVGGVDVAVEILNRVDSSTERVILDGLAQEDPDLAAEIKKRMLVFEDLVYLDTMAVQRVIREIDAKEWALALRTASAELSKHVFTSMSKRLTEMVREEMDYLGLVRLRDVEEAQQRIVAVIRQLEEAGEVVVSRTESSEVFV